MSFVAMYLWAGVLFGWLMFFRRIVGKAQLGDWVFYATFILVWPWPVSATIYYAVKRAFKS